LKAILVRPRFDDATEYTFDFAQEILDWCTQAGIEVVELTEGNAVRGKVEEELRKGADTLIFYDHGNESALIGQDEQPVIDLENCHWLAEKDVYTLACLSAKELGVEIWRRGGKFWGYKEVYGFTTDALDAFKQASNCGFMYIFIEAAPWEDALDKAKETFDQLSMDLVAEGKIMAAVFMRENGANLVAYNGSGPDDQNGEGCLLGLLKLPGAWIKNLFAGRKTKVC
jgi:hypothetical protein